MLNLNFKEVNMINFSDYNPDKTGKEDVAKLLNKAILDAKGSKLIIEEGIYKSSSIFLASSSLHAIIPNNNIGIIQKIDFFKFFI